MDRAGTIRILCERALAFLEEITPEENIIITEWKEAGINAESAFYSQALIQLRNEYCKKRKCLDCRIGNIIISQGKKLRNEELLEPEELLVGDHWRKSRMIKS